MPDGDQARRDDRRSAAKQEPEADHWRNDDPGADDGALWLGDGRQAMARFVLQERPRADAADALNDLRALGL